MADLASILRDPNFLNANEATKAAIFEKWAPQDPNFANANEATQQAIRNKYLQPSSQPAQVTQPDAEPAAQPLPSQQQADQESIARSVLDVPLRLSSGALSITKAAIDMFGAGSDAAKAVEGAQNHIAALFSAQSKLDRAEAIRIMDDAKDKGVYDQVVAGLKAFSQAPIDFAVEGLGTSIPTLAVGALTALSGGSPLLAGTAAGTIALGTGMGFIKGEVYDAVEAELKKKGVPPEEAAARAEAAQNYAGDNLDLIVAGGGINALAEVTGLGKSVIRSAVTNRIKKELSKEAAEKAISDTALKEVQKKAARSVPEQMLRTTAAETVGEAAQGGYEQLAQNIALQREGFDVPTMRGVVAAGTLEAAAAAPLGAGAGALEVRQARQAARTMEDVDAFRTDLRRMQAELKDRTRLSELEGMRTGGAQVEVDEQGNVKLDETGIPVISQLGTPRELTEEEQKEYDDLRAKLIPTGAVPTTPEEKAAAVEAEFQRLFDIGYEEADAQAQALANIEQQISEDEESKADEAVRVDARKQFAQVYDQYLAEGLSESAATMLAVEYMDEQQQAADRGEAVSEPDGQVDTSQVPLSSLSDTELDAFVAQRREALKVAYNEASNAATEEEYYNQLSQVEDQQADLEANYNAEKQRRELRLENLSDKELNNAIADKTAEIDELDIGGVGTTLPPEAEAVVEELAPYLAERDRRDRKRAPVTEKVSKAQRGLFDEGEPEADKPADVAQKVQRIVDSLGPEYAAKLAEARAQIESEQAARRGRGRPALTEEGSPERAAREKARKQAIADNTRNTRRVEAITARFNKLYREDAKREDILASALEEGGERGRFAVGKYIDELRRKEANLVAEMMLLYESMPDSVHRRRIGQLLYTVDPQTGRRDKPNPIITPEVFASSKRAIAEMMEEARQRQRSTRVTNVLSKAKREAAKESRGKDRQVATKNGEFNNVTTVKDALKLVKRTGTPFMRLLASRIYNAVGDTRFIVVERGDKLPDAFVKDETAVGVTSTVLGDDGKFTSVVYVRGASWGDYSQGINSVIVLHEALHAALDRKVLVTSEANRLGLKGITKREKDFLADIETLMDDAKRKFVELAIDDMRNESKDPLLFYDLADVVEGAKGAMFNDPTEFIAYAMSEPVFERFLNSYKPANSIRSGFGKFVDAVRKLFNFAPNQVTALTELVSAVDVGISTPSSRAVIRQMQEGVMSESAANRQRKLLKELAATLKRQQRNAKNYEESDEASKINEGIKRAIELRSGRDVYEALYVTFLTSTTKAQRLIAKVVPISILGDWSRLLGMQSITDGNKVLSKMNSMADNLLSGAQETINNTFRAFQGSPKRMAAFVQAAIESTLANVDPDTNLSSPKLNELYAALDSRAKTEFRRIRDYFQAISQMYTRLLDDRVKNLGASKQEQDNVLEKIKALFEVGDKIYPFFPLKRFGEYFVRIGTGPTRKFFLFESEYTRDQYVARRAKEAGKSVKDFLADETKVRVGEKYEQLANEILGDTYGKLLKDVFDAIDGMKGVTEEDKNGAKDEVFQTYLTLLPDQSIRKQFLHREGITGYSTDFLRAFVDSATHNAFQLSRIKYAPELRRASAASLTGAGNNASLRVLAQEFESRVSDDLNSQRGDLERRMIDTTVRLTNQASFIYYLSSVASPMLQLFQLTITGFPTLGANYGFAKTTFEATKLLKVWNQYTIFKKNADGSVTMTAPSLARSKAVQMNDRERRAMEKLLKHDVVRVTLAAEINELSKAPVRSTDGSYTDAAKTLFMIPAKLMQATEQMSREKCWLTAYRLAYKKHGNHETAIEEAADYVSGAMGNFAGYSRPPFMRGPVGRLAFQFMFFCVFQLSWYLKNMLLSLPYLNKEGKAIAAKTWLSSLGVLYLVTGMQGFPFGLGTMLLGAMSQIFDDVDDDDLPEEQKYIKDMKLEYWLRKYWLPEQVGDVKVFDVPLSTIIEYGPLSAFTGADFASRLSLNGVFIRESKDEANLEAALTSQIIDAAGPGVNMLKNIAQGIDALNVGDIQKFVEKVAPAAMRAPIYAEKYSRQGVVDWQGTVLTPEAQVSMGKLIAQSLGFRPLELTDQGYRAFTKRAIEQAIKNEKNRIYDRYYVAYKLDDKQKQKSIRNEDIPEFNKKYKSFAITSNDLERSITERVRRAAIRQKTGGFDLNESNAPLVREFMRQQSK